MNRDRVWKRSRIVGILLVLLAGGAAPSPAAEQELKKLAGELAARIHAAKRSRVTVVDFVDLDRKPSKLGSFVAQLFQLALADPEHRLDVVDQSQLPQLFDQVELDEEGLLDPETKQVLGKVSATEVVIVGTVMPSSLSVRLDTKAIDLQSQKLIAAGNAKLARIGPIARLANEAAGGGQGAAADDGDDEVGSDDRGGAASAQTKPRPPARLRNDQGVAFELEGCSMSAGVLTCALSVTSKARDRWLSISFRSRAWNEEGHEHPPGDVTIANTSRQEHCAAKEILRDVPTPVSVTFPGFEEDALSVERLRLSWYEANDCCCYEWRPVDFEKIALSEDSDGSSRSTTRSGRNQDGSTSGKRRGFLQRTLRILEDTATEVLEQKAREAAGIDDEEEEDEPPA